MKRWIGFATVFVMLFSMLSMAAFAEEPTPTELSVEVLGDIIENWRFGEAYAENPETGEEELIESYFYGEHLEVTVTYSDGSVQSGPLYELIYEYDLELKLVDDQRNGKWGLGVHPFTVTLGDLSASGEIEVVKSPVKSIEATCAPILEGTEGSLTTDYDSQTKLESEYYFNYYIEPMVTLEIVMESGETYSGSSDDIWEATREYPEFTDNQSAEAPWEVGKHTATVNFWGGTTEIEVEILESDIESFAVADTTLTEGTNTENRTYYDEDGNEHNWKAYWYLDEVEYTVTMKDSEPFVGTRDDIFEEFGVWVEHFDDQDYTNQWGVGNHQATFYLLGETASGNVIIEESEIRSISAAPASFEQNTYGSVWDIWDDDGEVIGSWYHYDWAHYLEYTVEMKNGDTFVGDSGEISDRFGVSLSYYDDQRADNPWDIGNHSGTVELMGKSCTVEITITELSYTDFTVQFPSIVEGESMSSETWEENGETFTRYYYDYYDLAEITVYDKDGNAATYSAYDLDMELGLNIQFSDNQSTEDWGVGEHTVTCSLLGKTYEATLTITENPIKSISATATCIENWDYIQNSRYDENGDPFEWREYDIFDKLIVTVEAEDETIVGTPEEIYEQIGQHVGIEVDQPMDELWGAGTYEFTVRIGGKTGTGILTVEPSPVESITATAPSRVEMSGGSYDSIWDEDGNELGRWYHYDPWNDLWLEVTLKDGRTYSGYHFGLEEALGISMSVDDPQTAENPWEVGTYEVGFNCMGYESTYEIAIEPSNVVSITVTANPIVENTGGNMNTYYDEELGEERSYYHYEVGDAMIFVVNLTEGDPIIGDQQAVYEALGVWPSVHDTQTIDGGWGVGTHSVEVELMGKTATASVEIVETFIESIELKSPNVLYQGLDDYPQEIYNEETGEYEIGWYYFMLEDRCIFTVTLKNGEVYEGPCYELNQLFDQKYSVDFYHDQNYGNEWQVGVQTFGVSFAGCMETFEIEVQPYPVQNITFADPVVLYHDAFAQEASFIDENNNEIPYTSYYYEPYFTVTLTNGSTVTGSSEEIEKEIGWFPSLEMQVPENELQIGENTVEIEFCNRIWEETVTIVEENPVERIDLSLAQGKDLLYAEQYLELGGATLQVHYTNGHSRSYILSAFADNIEGVYDSELGVVVYPNMDFYRLKHYLEGTQEVSFEIRYLGVCDTVTCRVRQNVASIELANSEDHSLQITFNWADGSSVTAKVLQIANGYSYPGSEWKEEGLLVTDLGVFWASFVTNQEGTSVTMDVGDACQSNVLEQADWLEAHKAVLPIAPYLIFNEVAYDGTLADELVTFTVMACNLLDYDEFVDYDENGSAIYRVDAEALDVMLKRIFGADADVTESGLYDAEQNCVFVNQEYRDYLTIEYSIEWTGNGWRGTLGDQNSGRWSFTVNEENVLTSFKVYESEVGDLDGSGTVDTADAVSLLKQINKGETDSEAADINGDGKVSLADVLRLLKQIAA